MTSYILPLCLIMADLPVEPIMAPGKLDRLQVQLVLTPIWKPEFAGV